MGYLLGNCWKGGTIEPDALRDALALLDDAEVSANLATNALNEINNAAGSGITTSAYFTEPTYLANGGEVPGATSNLPFSYSSLDWLDDKKKFAQVGGGHDDGLDSSTFFFDTTTLAWSRGDDGARYQNINDANYNAAAAVGLPFNSGDPLGWRVARNRNGRFAPPAMHTSGGICYMSDLGRVLVIGYAAFKNGTGSPGGAMAFDADTGNWDADYAYQSLIGQNLITFWLSGISRVLLVTTDAGGGDCKLIDPVGKTSENAGGWKGGAGAAVGNGNPVATLIPDPFNAGSKAALCLMQDTSKCWIVSRVDETPSPNKAAVFQSYANTRPSFSVSTAIPIYMGDHKTTNKIVVFAPGDGIYTLDISTWEWSAKLYDLTSVTHSTDGGSGTWGRFRYMPAYDAFGYFNGSRAGQFRAVKLPASVYA